VEGVEAFQSKDVHLSLAAPTNPIPYPSPLSKKTKTKNKNAESAKKEIKQNIGHVKFHFVSKKE
jgi:hypothetical protein